MPLQRDLRSPDVLLSYNSLAMWDANRFHSNQSFGAIVVLVVSDGVFHSIAVHVSLYSSLFYWRRCSVLGELRQLLWSVRDNRVRSHEVTLDSLIHSLNVNGSWSQLNGT